MPSFENSQPQYSTVGYPIWTFLGLIVMWYFENTLRSTSSTRRSSSSESAQRQKSSAICDTCLRVLSSKWFAKTSAYLEFMVVPADVSPIVARVKRNSAVVDPVGSQTAVDALLTSSVAKDQ